MKKFFNIEDFQKKYEHNDLPYGNWMPGNIVSQLMADNANAKLEREAKIVYSDMTEIYWTEKDTNYKPYNKAILINIEPIEKCKHPAEKVGTFIQKKVFTDYNNLPPMAKRDSQYMGTTQVEYVCQCGKTLKPKEFEEI